MADQKISEMPSALPLTGVELVPVVRGSSNLSCTTADLTAFAVNPAQLQFSRVSTVTFATVLPAGLVAVDEQFVSDSGQFTRFTEGTQGTFTVSGGQATIANGTAAGRNDIIVTGSDLAMPQIAVQIDVVSRSGTPAGFDNIGVGISKDANNFVWASYDRIGGQARIQLKISGVNTFNASVARTLTAPYKLALSLVANSACMWVDTGSGFEFVTGYSIPTGTINFKTASLTGWKAGWTVATPNNSTWVFDNLKAGAFGGFGFRDFSIVTNEDGSPYLSGSVAYFSATCADGLGQGHQGVFSIDTSTYAVTQVGALMVSRGGGKEPDVAGHLIRNGASSFRYTVATWGNGFGGVLDTHSGAVASNLLSGQYLVSGLTKLTLPDQASGYGAYDAMLAKDGAMWRLAYSVTENTSFTGSPFWLATATSPDLTTWTASGNDRSTKPYEGAKWVKFGSDYYALAGSSNSARVYDASANFRGYLQATFDGGSLTQPHPAIFDAGDKWMMLTFNQVKPTGVTASFTWGQLVVHEA